MSDYNIRTEKHETYLFYPCTIGQKFDYFVKKLAKIQGCIILRSTFRKELTDSCNIPADRQKEYDFENIMPGPIKPAIKVLISHANLNDLIKKYEEWRWSPEYFAHAEEMSELNLKRAMELYPEDFEEH